jgi:hypothetical protein
MGSSWSYDVQTKTVLIDPKFNGKLTGLPPDTKIIIFEEGHNRISKFNQPVRKKDLPPNVQRIEFGYLFDQPINKDSLPTSITHLTFGSSFDQPINKDSLPESITHLSFGYSFNQPLNKDSLPSSITHLTFGFCFNQPVNKDSLPGSITHLFFKWCFEQPVNELPDNLIFLELPVHYKQPIDNLPCGLKTLVISKRQPIANIKVPFGCEIIKI